MGRIANRVTSYGEVPPPLDVSVTTSSIINSKPSQSLDHTRRESFLTDKPQKGHAENVGDGYYCHIRRRACEAACAAGGRTFIAEQRLRHI